MTTTPTTTSESAPVPDYQRQHTLREPISLEGTGLHTGTPARITLKPADPSTGRIFIIDGVRIPARLEYAQGDDRRTRLLHEGKELSTVEHLLAALYLTGIDNCEIEVEGAEIPILDGTARPFVEAIQRVGTLPQEGFRQFFRLKRPFTWQKNEHRYLYVPGENTATASFFVTARLGNHGAVSVRIPLEAPHHNNPNHTPPEKNHLINARTFALISDILPLIERGLIQGASLNMAILIRDIPITHELEQKIRTATHDNQPYEQTELFIYRGRPPTLDEPAYHKALDLIGDLALLNGYLSGNLIAELPAHKTNVQFARAFLEAVHQEQKIPVFDPDQKGLMGIPEILKVLPHRHTFLLVDRILELSDTEVIGIKAVSYNEPFFQGHFPGNPVMPGVLIIEAMAQVGGVLALKTVPDPQNWDTYFLKLDKVRFKQIVRPGDTLVMRLILLSPIRRGLIHMRGEAYVGSRLVAEAELLARIIRKPDAPPLR